MKAFTAISTIRSIPASLLNGLKQDDDIMCSQMSEQEEDPCPQCHV